MLIQATQETNQAGQWADLAVARFIEGYNCSEAVLVTLADYLKIRSEIIPAAATGFGGGVGRCGDLCGAVSGGVMGLGLAVGRTDPKDGTKKMEAVKISEQLLARFQKRWNSVLCRELIGFVLKEPGMQERYTAEKVREKTCRNLVHFVMLECLDLIKSREGETGKN